MYKLYGYIPNLNFIKASFNESTIIEEIKEYIYKVPFIHFMIILQTEDRMIPYKTILTMKDFEDYEEEFINEKEKLNEVRKRVLK